MHQAQRRCNIVYPFALKQEFTLTRKMLESVLDLTLHEAHESISMLLYLICNDNVMLFDSYEIMNLAQNMAKIR